MQDIIAVLPESIANQIAAGEVIQRPASVVKELMENAIDAGASEIKVLIKDAGRTLIQVIDNGKGMSPIDARLCWERHATSKIRKTEDLFHIRSFGFRGEAMASIASVAQVEMRTRPEKAELGSLVVIEASKVLKQQEDVCPQGTSIAVKNLFYNIPARRNFLKSNAVEIKHIMDEFTRVSMPNPEVRFSIEHNGNLLLDLSPGDQKTRIAQLLALNESEIFYGEEHSPAADYRVFLGSPKIAKKTRGDQYFIVNGRFIKDPYLNHAITNTYKEYLPEDTFPTYVVFLELDPEKVDINVHPTKTEIKFEDEKTLYALLKSVIRKVLAENLIGSRVDSLFDDSSFQSFLQGKEQPEFPTEPKLQVNPSFNPFQLDGSIPRQKKNLGRWEEMYVGMESQPKEREEAPDLFFNSEATAPKLVFNGAPVMQLHQSFIVTQLNQEMLLVDQERAHERVLFERLIRNKARHKSASQQLLFPRVIEFSANDALLVEELLEEIRHLGFDINPFGNNSFIINGLPVETEKAEAKELLEGIVEEFKMSSGFQGADQHEKLAHALAKRSGMKKGRVMSGPEMTELLNDLWNCSEYRFTPDGKPVVIGFDAQQLAKLFA